MNDLERLKRAEEAGPMGVAVVGPMPEGCEECWIKAYDDKVGWCCPSHGNVNYSREVRPVFCPLQPAIGIIEPGCHIKYFSEDNNETDTQ